MRNHVLGLNAIARRGDEMSKGHHLRGAIGRRIFFGVKE
jgi:hypothetical protein